MGFISEDSGHSYNLCHFVCLLLAPAPNSPREKNKLTHYIKWSNFEIGDLNLWRSKAYLDYFEHLDKAGGFFYERWGDAPVHSIAAALFLPKAQIHFFNDIAYVSALNPRLLVSLANISPIDTGIIHLPTAPPLKPIG